MIRSFADKETERIFNQSISKRLPYDIQRVALRKLIMLDKTECIKDLVAPPGNHLERLGGDREGQLSIRINDRCRVCFWFEAGDCHDVEIVDYH